MVFTGALTALLALTSSVTALPTISAYGACRRMTRLTAGSKFFTADGDQWFVKGIAYQLLPGDPLLNTTQCELDAALMQQLGANAIRVYHVEDGDHRGCMGAFDRAGIYLFVDLDTFDSYILPDQPEWTTRQSSKYEAVMDEFQQFDNVAGFFIGNEVLTSGAQSGSAAYVKAATRDLKAYRDAKGYRKIPVGYSHADVTSLRPNLQNYLACGNASDALDFFGLNAYEWCGENTYSNSGYQSLTEEIKAYPIPIFFSETGCNTVRPRTFADQGAVFGPDMAPYWSGSIIYEWVSEINMYGLITYGGNTDANVPVSSFNAAGSPTPMVPDFANLKTAWAAVAPRSTPRAEYAPSLAAPSCPPLTPGTWLIDGDAPLPTLATVADAGGSSGNFGTGTLTPTQAATTFSSSESTPSSPTSSSPTSSSPPPSSSASERTVSNPTLSTPLSTSFSSSGNTQSSPTLSSTRLASPVSSTSSSFLSSTLVTTAHTATAATQSATLTSVEAQPEVSAPTTTSPNAAAGRTSYKSIIVNGNGILGTMAALALVMVMFCVWL